MTAKALRKIEAELLAMAKDSDLLTPQAVKLAAWRIGAQAEMLEQGIAQ